MADLPFETAYPHNPTRHDTLVDVGDGVALTEGPHGSWEVWTDGSLHERCVSEREGRLIGALAELHGDDLNTDGPWDGVPPSIAVSSSEEIGTWLFVSDRDRDVGDVAEMMDVSRDTVIRYLSRVRSESSF